MATGGRPSAFFFRFEDPQTQNRVWGTTFASGAPLSVLIFFPSVNPPPPYFGMAKNPQKSLPGNSPPQATNFFLPSFSVEYLFGRTSLVLLPSCFHLFLFVHSSLPRPRPEAFGSACHAPLAEKSSLSPSTTSSPCPPIVPPVYFLPRNLW